MQNSYSGGRPALVSEPATHRTKAVPALSPPQPPTATASSRFPPNSKTTTFNHAPPTPPPPALHRLLANTLVRLSLPWVHSWARRTSQLALRHGRPLSPLESSAAAQSGVQHPEHIRVLSVPSIPMPGFAWQQRLAATLGFDGRLTAGMALHYAIFLRLYLTDCLVHGYYDCPFEQEARSLAAAPVFSTDP